MSLDRRAALRAGLVGGGVVLAATALAPFAEGVDRVLAAGDDAAVLTTLALLEDTAVHVLTTVGPGLTRAPLPGLAQSFLTHHRDHRAALLSAIRELRAAPPRTEQPHPDAVPSSPGEAPALAALLEIEGRLLGAQYAALAALRRQSLRVQVASIFGVDARHAAVWRSAGGQNPVPGSFVTGP
ncbi:MAG TPA: ferritin-like domain-containing protein [Candidatus Dormibacteraeota bacterium]|nr:ferritin-like domain-containing protein [Candidatus Dormibacteraeota bacterium]